MPIDTATSLRQWNRYAFLRDQGHRSFVEKHDKCERFFAGDQWDASDLAAMRAIRRPTLTINKIISTISNLMGEQIYNRAEISYRARSGANPKTADDITKVFKYISDNTQLEWKRSDMFADGVIGSRGFLDVRMVFDENMQGDVSIENINPKNVVIDKDADQYDPDTWNEVFTTRWMAADEIEVLYSKADADLLRGRDSMFPYGYDSIDRYRDRFGGSHLYMDTMYGLVDTSSGADRLIRVIDRQYRKVDRQLHFVYPKTGETRPVPEAWDQKRVQYVAKEFGLSIIKKIVRRIRWTCTADNVVLHDEWSPYKHFTIVPYFPYLRYGRTIGLVENLIDPQDLLNKSESQTLHVVNTTANSGYIVKTAAVTNMTSEELEQRGAETGIVIEVQNDVEKDIKKIQPNNVPQGLDRVSFKAEEYIGSIAGVSKSQLGFDREDVAGKAIQQKRKASQTTFIKPLDSLTRTDTILARNILDLIQEFFSEERIITITKDPVTGETENVTLNQTDPETGEILNDLTVGEYGAVVTSVPSRETLEDSEFEQLVSMRTEMGIKIPDAVIINASRLRDKVSIIKAMEGNKDTPEGQAEAERQKRLADAQVSLAEGEAATKHADAGLRDMKAKALAVDSHVKLNEPQEAGATPGLDVAEAEREHDRKDAESAAKITAVREKSNLEREKAVTDAQLKAQQLAQQEAEARVARMTTSPTKEPA